MSLWFNQFYAAIAQSPLSHWLETLPSQLKHWQNEASHGDLPKWQKVLKNLPEVATKHVNIIDKVEIGAPGEMTKGEQKQTIHLLKRMMPWRKGPFSVHGIEIDTEWRSD